jgi:hypothetical protein
MGPFFAFHFMGNLNLEEMAVWAMADVMQDSS